MRGYSLTIRILAVVALAFALVGGLLEMASAWLLVFGLAFLSLLAALAGLVVAVLAALLGLVSLVTPRLRGAVGLRTVLIGLAAPAVVVALLFATFHLTGPLTSLNFKVFQQEREQAAEWALAESQSRAFSPYGEPLPEKWQRLSDSGEVIVVESGTSRGVLFFATRGILEGTVWMYADDPDLADAQLEEPVRLDGNWWIGGM